MTDEVFNEFRARLLECRDSPIVSVKRGNGNVVTIVARGPSERIVNMLRPLVFEFNIGNSIAIEYVE
ncbi:MAG: hypothetical protein ABIO06_08415 [Pseudolysinimonas sp.]